MWAAIVVIATCEKPRPNTARRIARNLATLHEQDCYTAECRATFSKLSRHWNDKADRLWNWINAEYKRFDPRFAGAYVCKSIATSGTLSQHSYGNALDVFFDSLSHQDEVAHAVVANRQLLSPFHIISKDRIWTKDVGWHDYVGEYHRHLHVDFDPQFTGPCGVKP